VLVAFFYFCLKHEYKYSDMNLPVTNNMATMQPVEFFRKQRIQVDLLRLDKIHTVISGNKWYKLKEWLKIAIEQRKEGVFTAGGAYSNHIVATACAAQYAGLKSAAIIRGEQGEKQSKTLADARSYGMELHFFSRKDYGLLKTGLENSGLIPANWLAIPEGGQGQPGVLGASSILDIVPSLHDYSHIICAVGTGTMLAGLTNAAFGHQKLIGISSLKGDDNLTSEIKKWQNENAAPFSLLYDYHFGGYAKHPPSLLNFMNELYRITEIPTDIVYTGKMLFGLQDLVKKGHFQDSDKVLAIHSGGLQGNRSLNSGQLIFL
jgi:1-aminocyclopropane-1-carboxylate deaminase